MIVSGSDAQGDVIGGDIENVRGGSANDTLIGSAVGNELLGGNGSDSLAGMGGSDMLDGGAGDDALRGGAGADALAGGAGIDTATYSDSVGGVIVNLTGGTAAGSDAQGDSLSGIENLNGSQFGDELFGSATDNVLSGLGGGDLLFGAGGNDLLIGGAGADRLIGGGGVDTVSYGEGSIGVVVDLDTGLCSGGNAQGDEASDIDNAIGSQGNDRLTGHGGANLLRGGVGNDILDGGFGADVLDGGSGIDLVTYFGAVAGVKVNLQAGTGSDGEAQGDGYVSIENVNGGQGGDVLTGHAGGNALNGFEGNDVIAGGAGKDALGGGIGADIFRLRRARRQRGRCQCRPDRRFQPGPGRQDWPVGNRRQHRRGRQPGVQLHRPGLYHHVAGELRFAVTGGVTTIAGDVNGDGASDFHIVLAGASALQARRFRAVGPGRRSASLTISCRRVRIMTVFIGSEGFDAITGTADGDTIDAAGGDDNLAGLDGNDSIFGSEGDDDIDAGEGSDFADGGVGDDDIFGAAGDDRLEGGRGSDSIDGGDGDDAILGGIGDDLLTGGSGSDSLDGREGADIPTGNDGDDILVGGAGSDAIEGGAGADILVGETPPVAGVPPLGQFAADGFIWTALDGTDDDRILDFFPGSTSCRSTSVPNSRRCRRCSAPWAAAPCCRCRAAVRSPP